MSGSVYCMFPDCKRKVTCRGLCASHATTARVLVKLGKTTWEKLEKAGKCLEARRTRGDGRVRRWFLTPQGSQPGDPTPEEIAARKAEALHKRKRP